MCRGCRLMNIVNECGSFTTIIGAGEARRDSVTDAEALVRVAPRGVTPAASYKQR